MTGIDKRSGSLARPAPSVPRELSPKAEPTPAVDVPELRPIFDAMRRGTKRSKLRTLVVTCQEGHTVLEVFPTTSGPVMVWQDGGRLDWSDSGSLRKAPLVMRAAPVGDLSPTWEGDWLPVTACRCQEAGNITIRRLLNALDAGARRVVLTL